MIDRELLDEFIIEAREHLDYVERDLVKLEKEPKNVGIIKDIFGSIHSIKGSSGYIGLKNLYDLTHAMESVLDHLRKSKLQITEIIYDRLFEGVDKIKSIIDLMEKTGETDQDVSDIVDRTRNSLGLNEERESNKNSTKEEEEVNNSVIKKSNQEETAPAEEDIVDSACPVEPLDNLDEFLEISEEIYDSLKNKVESFTSAEDTTTEDLEEIYSIFENLLQIAEYHGFDNIWKKLVPMADTTGNWLEERPSNSTVKQWFKEIQTILNKSFVEEIINDLDEENTVEIEPEMKEDDSSSAEIDFVEVFGDYDQKLVRIFIESLRDNLERINEIGTDLDNSENRKKYLKTVQWIYQSANYMDVSWIKKIAFQQLEILNSCTEKSAGVDKQQSSILEEGFNTLIQLVKTWEENYENKKEDEEKISENQEIYNFMDEDKELLNIFIDNFEGHLEQLLTIITKSQHNSFENKYFDMLIETISMMESASNYMNYEELHQYCIEAQSYWEEMKNNEDFLYNKVQNNLIKFVHKVADYLIQLFPEEKERWQKFLDIPLAAEYQEEETVEESPEDESDFLDLNEIFNEETESQESSESIGDEESINESTLTAVINYEEENNEIEWDGEEEAENKEEPVSSTESEVAENIKRDVKYPTLRVDINKVENLMAIIGELVVNRSAFSQLTNEFRDIFKVWHKYFDGDKRIERLFKSVFMKLDASTANLGRITNQVQEGIMSIRMVPISNLFNRFPRMIREIAKEAHKEVELELVGEDTELDKTVIEEIADPIVHILRNAIDHGIEDEDKRRNAGKPLIGKIIIKAFHESGKINIEISDDGQGIDEKQVLENAIKNKLVDKNQARYLTKEEIFDFLFTSGFSTSSKVSNLSGRGVGLDVVKRNIDKLNGTVQLQSEIGKGTSVIIQIPLTLAIIQALLVKVQSNDFCIPLTSVSETLKVGPGDIDTIEGHAVYYYRNQVISLVYLNEIFGFPEKNFKSNSAFLVVVNSGSRKIGIVVDELIAQQDIVIKPLEEDIIANEGITGAAILGGGEIALIIDVPSLINFVMDKEKRIRKHFPKLDTNVVE